LTGVPGPVGQGRTGRPAGHPFAAAWRHDGVRGVRSAGSIKTGDHATGGGHDPGDPRRPTFLGCCSGAHAARLDRGWVKARTLWSRSA
jgi:hypothetical protein